MTGVGNRLLMIDDEPAICEFVGAVARKLGFDFQSAVDADDFRRLRHEFEPTALVLDLHMPDVDGIEVLRYLAEEQCQAQILVISGEDRRVLTVAERLGAAHGLRMADALQKPILLPALRSALDAVMQRTITSETLGLAIGGGELVLYYQPKLALSAAGAWTIVGAEALMRWHHRALGTVMPAEFIPLAAQTDLSHAITELALREALAQLGQWLEHGLDLNVAVNVPPELLTDIEFPDRVADLLQQYKLDGSHLTLEVTETSAVENRDAAMDILARLRLKDVQIAIDDFGTGHSSLKQLFYMPFSELKIDGSFTTEIATSTEARTMVRTMIQMAHNLNLSVCAEAVESREALDFLEAQGCDTVQGFFFSEALPAEEFERFVGTWTDQDRKVIS